MKSLTKPKDKRTPPAARAPRPEQEARREVEGGDKAQCCAKRSKATAGCHD